MIEQTKKFKDDFAFYVQVCLTYSFVLSITYLCGFWWTFDINIFPFLTLYSLVSCAISPFVLLLISLITFEWLILTFHVSPYISKYIHKKLDKIFQNSEKDKKFLQKKIIIPLVMLVIIVTSIGIFFKLSTLFLGFPIFIMVTILYKKTRLKKEIDETTKKLILKENSIMFLLLLFLLLPFITYDYGHYNAKVIFYGKKYPYILDGDDSNKTLYKYLGFVNNNHFFLDQSNNILLIKHDVPTLELHKFSKEVEVNNPQIGFN